MSKYYKVEQLKNVPFPTNVAKEVSAELFHEECKDIETKAKRIKLNFASWWIPETKIRVFGLVETNTIYGFVID